MKKIEHEIKIKSDVATVYQALVTKKGLESWHSAHVTGGFKINDAFQMTHEEHASFKWKITNLKDNDFVEWECVDGPGSAPGTHVKFEIIPTDEKCVLVKCIHDGWNEDNANFTKCNTLWGILLFHLKQFAETGKSEPTFA